MRDIIRRQMNNNLCHPLFFAFKLALMAGIIFFGGTMAIPFSVVLTAFSNINFDTRADYMIPLTMKERLGRLRLMVIYRTLVGTIVIVSAVLWGRYTTISFLQGRVKDYSLWYLIPVVLFLFCLNASTVVEQCEGVEVKHFVAYNADGYKKRRFLSISGVTYWLVYIYYIALFVMFISMDGSSGDRFLMKAGVFMIVTYAVAILCTIVNIGLLRRISIGDYHGTETPSLIADATAGI